MAERQVELVLKICGEIHQTIKNSGIVTEEGDNHPFPLLHAHSELLAKGKALEKDMNLLSAWATNP